MKLNEKKIELLKNTEVIIHNTILRADSDLLNQIIGKCIDHNPNISGDFIYYGICKTSYNTYDWYASDYSDSLLNYLKKPESKNILSKPISWFFEEDEINNIIILLL